MYAGGSNANVAHLGGINVKKVTNYGMNLLHISSYWQRVVIGAIILLAVILDMSQKKKKV